MFSSLLNQLLFGTATSTVSSEQNVNNNINENYDDKFDLIDKNDIDWVLVNPYKSKTSRKLSINKNTSTKQLTMSTSDYGLRNLLEETVNEIEQDKELVVEKDGQWLITPLPLITTTSSQHSIIDNGIENLLIEHPSMSVFIKATNNNNNEKSINKIHNKKLKNKKKKTSSTTTSASTVSTPNVIRNLIQQQNQQQEHLLKSTQKRLSKHQQKLNKQPHYKHQQRNNVNIRQRKYHMLYQPRVCSIVQ